MTKKTRNTKDPVEKERALEHALLSYRRSWAARTHGLEPWGTAELDPDPLVIHDLNGEPLFYEFSAQEGNEQVGRIKASATKRLGAPVVTLESGPRRWDPARGTELAKKQVAQLYPKARIEDTELVCYCYPKIGVRVDIVTETQESQSLVFDVASGTEVTRFGDDQFEGEAAHSLLDALPPHRERDNALLWELRDKEREAAQSKSGKIFSRAYTANEAAALRDTLTLPSRLVLLPFFSSRVLKFGPRCSPHDCFELYAQQTDVYCAVATGQMILDFYRYYYSQDDIADAMNTGAGGTTNANQVIGYESLSDYALDATYDTTANWSEAKAEIDANRPVKSGVPYHARACAGWKRQNIFLVGQPPKKWLRIYDPWPWSEDICEGGAIYWEDWDAVTHTNFIYVRHAT